MWTDMSLCMNTYTCVRICNVSTMRSTIDRIYIYMCAYLSTIDRIYIYMCAYLSTIDRIYIYMCIRSTMDRKKYYRPYIHIHVCVSAT